MNKLIVLLSSILISLNSYGEWIKINNADSGSQYIDTNSIKESNGYVYFWELGDWAQPRLKVYQSAAAYTQADCKVYRHKNLTLIFYKEQMGKGPGKEIEGLDKWKYPAPNTIGYSALNYICEYVK